LQPQRRTVQRAKFKHAISLIFIFGSCSTKKKENPVFILPDKAPELLAGQESKTWKLAKEQMIRCG
jgi:ABC-type uncharacterized transport system auxiliary subunit